MTVIVKDTCRNN